MSEFTVSCGCTFTLERTTATPGSSQLTGPDKTSITYCPLHQAAPAMRDALEDALPWVSGPLAQRTRKRLQAVISQARGEAGT